MCSCCIHPWRHTYDIPNKGFYRKFLERNWLRPVLPLHLCETVAFSDALRLWMAFGIDNYKVWCTEYETLYSSSWKSRWKWMAVNKIPHVLDIDLTWWNLVTWSVWKRVTMVAIFAIKFAEKKHSNKRRNSEHCENFTYSSPCTWFMFCVILYYSVLDSLLMLQT